MIDAETGEAFRWQPKPMVLAISTELRARIKEAGDGELRTYRFRLADRQQDGSSPDS